MKRDERGQRGGERGVNGEVSRRSFIQTLGLSAAAGSVGARVEQVLARQGGIADEPAIRGPEPFEITLNVNGVDITAVIDPATTLMEMLRWHARLTGTKEVCDRGSCGGCSVLVDGRLTVSCMMLAVDAEGAKVQTVEGLEQDGKLDRLQASFIRHDGLQCGYCTPGLVMACKAVLDEHAKPTMGQIRQGLSGNICRCGTYTNIFNAVLEASGQPVAADQGGGT